ncbi:SOS response-associated peptidase [Mycoplasmatota bacterium]|nr:SOS response-associated peptidase [Mycoplasmatota bacterium]
MCGRFTIAKSKSHVLEYLKKHFAIEKVEGLHLPRYNVGPGQDILAVIYDGDHYRAGTIPWDYKVKYKGRFKQVINARSESVDEKYAFKNAFRNQRCLILSDGFYEWDQLTKRPYRFVLKNNDLYFYAGIYDRFQIEDKLVFGSLILTTDANDVVSEHHSRMPVILNIDQAKAFLRKDLEIDQIKALLQPALAKEILSYPVDKSVNKMSHDSSELIKKTTNH